MSNEKKHILDGLFVGNWNKEALRGLRAGAATAECANDGTTFYVDLHVCAGICEYVPVRLGKCALESDAETAVELLNSYMGNNNCLEGFMCPACGQSESFSVAATAFFDVEDMGTDDYHDVTWERSDTCVCKECSHAGEVRDFLLLGDKETVYIVARESAEGGSGFDWYTEEHTASEMHKKECASGMPGKVAMFTVLVASALTDEQITEYIDNNLESLWETQAKEGK